MARIISQYFFNVANFNGIYFSSYYIKAYGFIFSWNQLRDLIIYPQNREGEEIDGWKKNWKRYAVKFKNPMAQCHYGLGYIIIDDIAEYPLDIFKHCKIQKLKT